MTDQTTRRDFLRTAAAVTAAGTLFPTEEILADSRPVPAAAPHAPLRPEDPVRLGVIGTGGMGPGHMEALVNTAKAGRANLQVVALSDVCQPRMMDARMKKGSRSSSGVTTHTVSAHCASAAGSRRTMPTICC